MNEDLLHHIWKFQLFKHSDLKLTSGEDLQVISSGLHNHDAGPDFFNGQIKVGDTKWAGNIEIHSKSSHWYLHNHQENQVYDKVILHVVWEDDQPVSNNRGIPIPTLELKGLVSKYIIDKFKELKANKTWIPCEKELPRVNSLIKLHTVEQKLVERLKQKSDRVEQLLQLTTNDWEATTYLLLAKYFGFKINAVPFELLASSIDYAIVRKHQSSEKQLSALFFGQAGFLNENLKGSYPLELLEEYNFLQNKYGLQALKPSIWKFMRMRPANFPTIRIAQFISILFQNKNLFQRLVEEDSIANIKKHLSIKAGTYWHSHFRFDIPASKNTPKPLGDGSINILLINTLIPLLFKYGEKTGNEQMKEKALRFLQELPPESNVITKKWKSLGMNLASAFDSQGLLQLKTAYCDNKNCLNCSIGNSILKKE